jgi:alanyl-tRNA synthetase
MEDLPTAVGEMVEENRRLRRELEKRRATEVTAGGEDLLSRAEEVGGIRLVATLVDGSMQDLLTLSRELTSRPGVVFIGVARGDRANLLVTTGEGVVLDASEIARAMAAVVGGKAGGRPTVAQGAGPDLSAAAAALEAGKARARALLASSSPSANLETKG